MNIIGYNTIGGSSDNFSGNTLVLIGPYTAASSGSLSSLSIYSSGARSGNIVMGLYADNAGTPESGAKLVQTPETAYTTDVGWITLSLSSSYSLVSGHIYWIAVNTSGGINYQYTVNASVTFHYKTVAYDPTLPDPCPTPLSEVASFQASMYGTYGGRSLHRIKIDDGIMVVSA